jgi:hypothetical protein
MPVIRLPCRIAVCWQLRKPGKENMLHRKSLPKKWTSCLGSCRRSFVAKSAGKCHKRPMCFHATISGAILPVWSKTAYDEVMLHCARIGFKP